MLFRRSGLERVGGFDATFEQAADVEWVLRLALMGYESTWVPRITVHYRQHEGNASRAVQRQVRECERVLDRVFQESRSSAELHHLEAQARYNNLAKSARILRFKSLIEA